MIEIREGIKDMIYIFGRIEIYGSNFIVIFLLRLFYF